MDHDTVCLCGPTRQTVGGTAALALHGRSDLLCFGDLVSRLHPHQHGSLRCDLLLPDRQAESSKTTPVPARKSAVVRSVDHRCGIGCRLYFKSLVEMGRLGLFFSAVSVVRTDLFTVFRTLVLARYSGMLRERLHPKICIL